MYDIILFDLDGTLTKSEFGIIGGAIYALSKFNIVPENKEELKKFIGPPLAVSFREYYHFSEEKTKEAVGYYQEYMREKGIYEAPLYDGIKELLEELKQRGKRMFVATSKPGVFATQIIRNLQIEHYFEGIVGSNLDGTRADKAEVITFLLDKYAVSDKSKVVMVGDRKYDINGAKRTDIDSVGVLYGYGDKEELVTAGATHIVSTPVELIDIV